MFWANFLHFYQPPNQQKDILEQIVHESYQPLLEGFLKRPYALATFNINAGLIELWARDGYWELIQMLKKLLERGQIELTGSAKYHAFLPLLPRNEIIRQIKLNTKTLKKYLGDDLKLNGFFTPELAYDPKVATVVSGLGFEWMVAPQIALGPKSSEFNRIYTNKNLRIFFRDKRLSVLILSGYVHTWQNLLEEIPDYFEDSQRYSVTIMDAETFGHHRPGLTDFLLEIYDQKNQKSDRHFEPILVSGLPKFFSKIQKVDPRASTWSNEEQDFWLDKEQTTVSKHPFILWNDPQNPIHKLQWEFANWVIKKVKGSKDNLLRQKARDLLDQALSSDQFWWASAKPWWSLEMIEQGAYHLKEVIEVLHEKQLKKKARSYYYRILDLAFTWQRTGKIRELHREEGGGWRKIPFKKRARENEYKQFILEFEDEMKKAAEQLEFEKAINWRDAIIKLKKGTDLYDAFHVVDQLWAARGKIPQLKNWQKYKKSELSEFVKDAWNIQG